MIDAHADIDAGVILGSALADDYVSGLGHLAVGDFDSQSFRLAVAAQARYAGRFLR